MCLMPRAGVLELTPYPHGESSVPGVARVIRLASNENALAPSPRALEAFCAAAREVNRYPEPSAAILREMLAARFGLDASRIVCGSGSGELIELLARAYAGAGDEVLCSEFGYLLYQTAARRAGATPVMAPEPDLVAVVDALTRAVTERTRVVFLANPNNPTGSYLSEDGQSGGGPTTCYASVERAARARCRLRGIRRRRG